MKPIVINCPSIANCNTLELRNDIEELRKAGVTWLHIDFMDGNYVPNLGFPIRLIKDLREAFPDMTLDVHLMVNDPISYVERMAEGGADYLSFHIDSTNFVIRTLERIKKAGMKADVETGFQYRNMGDGLRERPEAVDRACNALARLGRTAIKQIVRGGTDGSRLTEMGLPTPNLTAGSHNPHAVVEWANLDEMLETLEWALEIVRE